MIIIENTLTAERQCVGSLEGYGDDWEQIGPELPAGTSPDAVTLVDGAWVGSPLVARDAQWAAAKVHWAGVAAGGFELDGVGSVQTDEASLISITLLVDEARDRIEDGEADWSTAFVNEANEAVPVAAPQILDIYRAVRGFLGGCYAARQAIRAVLDAALAAGASADEINAIDITVDPTSGTAP